jgi:hypothetical protein
MAPRRDRCSLLLVGGIVLLAAAMQVVEAARSTLFSDDLAYFSVARELGLSGGLLRRSANGHFVPGFHLANLLYWKLFGMSWLPAMGILVGMWVLAVVAFRWVLAGLDSSRRAAIVTSFVFALSPIPIASALWWAAGISLTTSTAFGLIAIGAFVWWDRDRRRWCLVAMAASLTVALAFWEKSLLVPVNAVVLSVVLIDRGAPWRERALRFLSRWPAWIAFALPATVDLWFFLRGGYLAESKPAAVWPTIRWASTAFWRGFVPGMVGVKPDSQTLFGSHTALLVLAWIAFGLVVAWLTASRVGTAPGWVFFALTAILNTLLLARGRAAGYPSAYGLDFRYHLDNLVLFCITLGWVVSRPRTVRGRVPAVAMRFETAAVVGVVVLYVALNAVTGDAIFDGIFAKQSRAVMTRFEHDFRTAREDGSRLPILDTIMPWPPVLAPYPYDRASRVLSLYEPRARFSHSDEVGWWMQSSGELLAARFVAGASIEPAVRCSSSAGTPAVLPVQVSQVADPGSAISLHFDHDVGGVVNVALRWRGSPLLYLNRVGGIDLGGSDPSFMVQLPTQGVGTASSVMDFDDIAVYPSAGRVCIRTAQMGGVLALDPPERPGGRRADGSPR